MMRWSRPDILNYVHEFLMMMICTIESHIKAMKRIMTYVVTTEYTGLRLKPNTVWNEGRDYLFEVTGIRNSDYAKDYSKKSVIGWYIFMNGATTSFRSKIMPIIALSVT